MQISTSRRCGHQRTAWLAGRAVNSPQRKKPWKASNIAAFNIAWSVAVYRLLLCRALISCLSTGMVTGSRGRTTPGPCTRQMPLRTRRRSVDSGMGSGCPCSRCRLRTADRYNFIVHGLTDRVREAANPLNT